MVVTLCAADEGTPQSWRRVKNDAIANSIGVVKYGATNVKKQSKSIIVNSERCSEIYNYCKYVDGSRVCHTKQKDAPSVAKGLEGIRTFLHGQKYYTWTLYYT